MLKFLFGGKKDALTKAETHRESFERVIGELNSLIEAQGEKPKIIVDPSNGSIQLDLPEQLADEALALPAPEKDAEAKADSVEEKVEDKVEEKTAA